MGNGTMITEQLISANVATNLYWLGRYIERIESTLVQVISAYDCIIDVQEDAGKRLYDTIGIKIEYENAMDFLREAITGEHSANLITIAGFARENAIIGRNYLNTEMFGEIIALHSTFQNIAKSHVDIDYKLIDTAQSLVSEIWGELSKRKYKKFSDNFIKLGKLIEEADFLFRVNEQDGHIASVLKDIDVILLILQEGQESQPTLQMQDSKAIMHTIIERVNNLIVE
jgi:uncharacterized alpha-E superfamily protein